MLMLLCAVATWGQTLITDANNISGEKVYTITPSNTSNHGVVCVKGTESDKLYLSVHADATQDVDATNINQRFAFINVGDKFFLYSLGAQKFVADNGNGQQLLTELTDECLVKFHASTGDAKAEFPTVVEVGGDYLCCTTQSHFSQHGYVVTNWNQTNDSGTMLALKEYEPTDEENTLIQTATAVCTQYVNTIDYTNLNAAIAAAETAMEGYSFVVGDAVALQVDDANAPGYLLAGRPACDSDVLKNAIDNDPNTTYHSAWNVSSSDNHYLQIDLGAEATLNAFELNYTTRMSGNNGAPYEMTVAGSNDGENFTTISCLSKDDKYFPLPNSNAKSYSRIFAANEAYRYLRFTVTKSPNGNNSFGMSTFGIKEVTMTTPENGTKGMRFATLLKEINNAKALVDNASSTTEANNAANALNELTAIVSIECPFTLTTDINNPVCYQIKAARSMSENGQWGVPSFWKYNSTGDKVNKFTIEKYPNDDAAKDINTYWFFMEDLNTGLIEMYPYSNPVAMGYTTVGDGAEKLTNDHSAANFKGTYFKLVIKTDGTYSEYPYALQPVGYNTYVSNHSGYGHQMGFYSTLDDGGTRFTVIEAITPSKKLALLSEKIEEAQACTAGENIGDYSAEDIATLAELIATATTVANDVTSSDEACQAQIDALTNAMAYNIILPADGGYYTMTSVATKEYCAGAYVYAINTSLQRSESVTYNHNTLVFDKEIGEVPASIFKFIATSNKNEFKIMSALTGEYVKTFGKGADQMGSESEAKAVRIARIADGQITLTIPSDGYPMHAQQDNAVIVTWGAEPGNASTWNLNAVDPTILSHDLTIGDAEYATLKLGFNTEIPENVTCYTVSGINENGKAALKEIEGVLPANTAVIVNAAKGTYTFKYTSESGAEGENMLDGTCFTEVITPAANETYYILGAVDGVVGLYKPELDEAEGTAFENQPNKAYLVISTGNNAIQYFSFDFGGGTTGIEGVEAEGAVNGKIYDITGREVKAITAPGIYIVNGAKVVVK